jgi:hypothetical protein
MASIGIYGVMNYLVIQRKSEFAIRVNMGATRADVLWLVLGRAAAMIGAGTCVGLAGSGESDRSISVHFGGISARLKSECCDLASLARPAGLEPAAPSLEGSCSIQLSYGRTCPILTEPGAAVTVGRESGSTPAPRTLATVHASRTPTDTRPPYSPHRSIPRDRSARS